MLSAALAVLTKRIQIRAGSVALPLHHPVRVAEEWSLVDNLSHGRVAVSFASGWHTNDFIFAPDIYDERKEVMFRHIELIQKLWAGEKVKLPGAGGIGSRISDVATADTADAADLDHEFRQCRDLARAGAIGANVLAALRWLLAGRVGRTYRALSRSTCNAWARSTHRRGDNHASHVCRRR